MDQFLWPNPTHPVGQFRPRTTLLKAGGCICTQKKFELFTLLSYFWKTIRTSNVNSVGYITGLNA